MERWKSSNTHKKTDYLLKSTTLYIRREEVTSSENKEDTKIYKTYKVEVNENTQVDNRERKISRDNGGSRRKSTNQYNIEPIL